MHFLCYCITSLQWKINTELVFSVCSTVTSLLVFAFRSKVVMSCSDLHLWPVVFIKKNQVIVFHFSLRDHYLIFLCPLLCMLPFDNMD